MTNSITIIFTLLLLIQGVLFFTQNKKVFLEPSSYTGVNYHAVYHNEKYKSSYDFRQILFLNIITFGESLNIKYFRIKSVNQL